MDATEIYHKNQHSINLKKMVKGYSWEIKVYGDDLDKIRKVIKDQDTKLRAEYPEQKMSKKLTQSIKLVREKILNLTFRELTQQDVIESLKELRIVLDDFFSVVNIKRSNRQKIIPLG